MIDINVLYDSVYNNLCVIVCYIGYDNVRRYYLHDVFKIKLIIYGIGIKLTSPCQYIFIVI
jgi:hypothetical protein